MGNLCIAGWKGHPCFDPASITRDGYLMGLDVPWPYRCGVNVTCSHLDVDQWMAEALRVQDLPGARGPHGEGTSAVVYLLAVSGRSPSVGIAASMSERPWCKGLTATVGQLYVAAIGRGYVYVPGECVGDIPGDRGIFFRNVPDVACVHVGVACVVDILDIALRDEVNARVEATIFGDDGDIAEQGVFVGCAEVQRAAGVTRTVGGPRAGQQQRGAEQEETALHQNAPSMGVRRICSSTSLPVQQRGPD